MGELVRYLEHEVRRLGSDVRVGAEVTAEQVAAEEPDLVVVATGSNPPVVEIPTAGVPVLRTWDVLDLNALEVPHRVLVVDDGTGFWPMCSAAERLAGSGADVEIVTPAPAVGLNIPAESAAHLHRRLRALSVRYSPFTRFVGVTDDIITLADALTGEDRSVAADMLVVQVPNRPVPLDGRFGDGVIVEYIGDCVAPRRLSNAIFEANRVIRRLDDAFTPAGT